MSGFIKRATAAASAAVITLTATGCSNEFFKEYQSREEISVPTEISFAWWGGDARADYTFKGIKIFERENSDINVQPYSSDYVGYKESLDALYSFGKESDIIQLNYAWLNEYSLDGEGFYDLNTLSDEIALDNFTEEQLSYGMINGKLNAIPISLNAITFYYNEDMLKEIGEEIPETWDDLFECGSKLAAEGKYLFETANIYLWLMLTAHEEQTTGKAAADFDTENLASMMRFAKELNEGGVIHLGENYDKTNYFGGKCAGQLLWASDAQNYAYSDDSQITTVIGKYISTEEPLRSGWYVKPTSLYAISKNSDDPQSAARLLNYLLNGEEMAELQGIEKGIPLSRSALETLDGKEMLTGTAYSAGKMITDSQNELQPMTKGLEDTERINSFFVQLEQYMKGEKTAEAAAGDVILQS